MFFLEKGLNERAKRGLAILVIGGGEGIFMVGPGQRATGSATSLLAAVKLSSEAPGKIKTA